ncbi:MAG: hypothetical protein QW728_02360 [Thermoplasmata archaeon]
MKKKSDGRAKHTAKAASSKDYLKDYFIEVTNILSFLDEEYIEIPLLPSAGISSDYSYPFKTVGVASLTSKKKERKKDCKENKENEKNEENEENENNWIKDVKKIKILYIGELGVDEQDDVSKDIEKIGNSEETDVIPAGQSWPYEVIKNHNTDIPLLRMEIPPAMKNAGNYLHTLAYTSLQSDKKKMSYFTILRRHREERFLAFVLPSASARISSAAHSVLERLSLSYTSFWIFIQGTISQCHSFFTKNRIAPGYFLPLSVYTRSTCSRYSDLFFRKIESTCHIEMALIMQSCLNTRLRNTLGTSKIVPNILKKAGALLIVGKKKRLGVVNPNFHTASETAISDNISHIRDEESKDFEQKIYRVESWKKAQEFLFGMAPNKTQEENMMFLFM